MSYIDYGSKRKPPPSASESPEREIQPQSSPLPPTQSSDEVEVYGQDEQPPTASAPTASTSTSTARQELISLTKTQRHYLLKALVTIQMKKEGSDLEKPGAFTLYGFPFSSTVSSSIKTDSISINIEESQNDHLKGDFETSALDEQKMESSSSSDDLQEPLILRQMFHMHLIPFPGLDTAPKKYWIERIQVFFDECAARNFSTSLERSEMTKRHFFLLAGLRYLSNFFTRGVGLRGVGELKGPGKGEPGSEKWGIGKQWGKGTVKRGLSRPTRPDPTLQSAIDSLFVSNSEDNKAWNLAMEEVQRIRVNWSCLKELVIEDIDGLDEVINVLEIASLKNVPTKYRSAEEFLRIHIAFILHTLFVTSEDSDSIFNIIKGFNSFFPWLAARALLKFVNAGYVVEGILGLILARPLGAASLLQRYMAFVLNSEIEKIKTESQKPLENEIDDSTLCKKISDYVSRGDRNLTNEMANLSMKNQEDILTTVLLHFDPEGLDQKKKNEIKEMQRAFANSNYRLNVDLAYPDLKGDLKGSNDVRARKFAQLKLYLRSTLRIRDHQQALKIASGTLVVMIIKDSLSHIFYQLIKDIASVSNLSGRLADLHDFLDDLVKVRNGDDNSLEAWIALASRHEQSAYTFLHECRALAPQFLPFLLSAFDFMALSTSDPLNASDEEIPRIEINLENLLSDQPSNVDVSKILKEVDDLENYVKWQKVRFDLELRKNFLLSQHSLDSSSQLKPNSISDSMKSSLQDIDSLLENLMKSQGFQSNQGEISKGGRGCEQAVYDWAWFDEKDLFGSELTSKLVNNDRDQRYSPKNVSAPLPQMFEIRKLLPAFKKCLEERMPDYLE